MDFALTEEQEMIARSAADIGRDFPPAYWREKDDKEEFGEEFWRAISTAGFTGLLIPEEHGGAGKGMTELLIVMEELAAAGAGMAGAWYLILTEVLGAVGIMRHGTDAQKRKYLPGIASGDTEFCLGLTEPDAGSNTLNTRTRAVRTERGWVVNGSKVLISGADRAKGMLLVARTTPRGEAGGRTLGLSLFLVDLPNSAVTVTPIPKHGINYSHSCEVGINDLMLPEEALVPQMDRGWYSLLDTLNAERMSFTAAAVGVARLGMGKAIEYSRERKVFGDVPIGAHQGLQFHLAEAYAALEAAKVLNFKAAAAYDAGAEERVVGTYANMAKVVAVENAVKAVYWSMQMFGGYGYARDYDVERWWREINLIRLAPVTQQMALRYIGEHVLGMPRS
ncbi:MAG: acyl-CoA dehydrogenase family protein [Chloroflexota bacterium]